MKSLNIYLTFDGNCEDAFNHYKSVFGGKFNQISRFGEMPPQEGAPELTDEMKNRVMHISYTLPNGHTIMASDAMPGVSPELKLGNNFSLSIDAESEEEATKLFNGLSKEGEVIMPLQKTFWNAYFGMFTDKFGINWMVNFDYPQS